MRKFLIQNLSEKELNVVIEPWADAEVISPDGRVLLEYEEFEVPCELDVAVSGNEIMVGIMCETIKITGPSGERLYSCKESKKPM